MSAAERTSYDEVPYSDYAFHYTHPACMGAVAALFGMRPANPERCRVLELGCAAGANLIPMAYDLPGSEFVGIDLSTRQIDAARRTVDALGLTNIDVRQGNIRDVDGSFGYFDYIICHGVYSWVPADVREAILEVCRANLAPAGIAYLSYNTFPGWHLHGIAREMMTYHAGQFREPGERVRQSRALLEFVAQAAGARDPLFGSLMRREADLVKNGSDAYVYHEYLEQANEPVYFHQFAQHAAARGLQYVAEAQPFPVVQGLTPEACNTLGRLSRSLVQAEQYLDFVSNRAFRRSLLCRESVALRRPPRGEDVTGLFVTALVRPVNGPAANGSEEFRGRDASMSTDDPLLRAALHCLFEALPAALAFDELWERVRARVAHTVGDGHRRHLAEVLLHCYHGRLVELRLRPPALAVEAGDRPRASALARLQAATNQPLCNLCHQEVSLDPFDRLLLQQLDGRRGHDDLLEALSALPASSASADERAGAAVGDQSGNRHARLQALDASLQRIAGCGLLLAAKD